MLTTHDKEEAAELCDRIVIVHLGRVVATGTPAELCASVGLGASLDDAFIAYTGDTGEVEERGLRARSWRSSTASR